MENPKMSKKVAGYFAKQGNKKLAAHERREAAGKEEDTKAIAKQEERALKNAPASMKDYERKEHKEMGFKKGGKVKRRASRTMPKRPPMDMSALAPVAAPPPDMGMAAAPAVSPPAATSGGMGMGMGMKKGGMACGGMKYARGGGIESKGKTKGSVVKMARGGGIESKGKTRGRFC